MIPNQTVNVYLDAAAVTSQQVGVIDDKLIAVVNVVAVVKVEGADKVHVSSVDVQKVLILKQWQRRKKRQQRVQKY